MHPPLYKHHPLCKEEVEALVLCHKEHSLGKWFNACNEVKSSLDMCFKAEKNLRKKLNKKVAIGTHPGITVKRDGPAQTTE